ncbi:MAG TPA: hypothetical protein EYP01_05245, partial [Candidatus Poseidoniales archaeon]|nr:hypothetical protein [Candidatus Poseidoniales archaeon]
MIDVELVEEAPSGGRVSKSVSDMVERARALPVPVLAVAALILVGGSGGAILYGDDIMVWIRGEPDYELIEFDPEQARIYAQSLVDVGHPEWEGRLSGTLEEENAAAAIKFNFSSMGIPATLE